MWEIIKELECRSESRNINLNFLYKHNKHNIYVMDNHRAALWCWLQALRKSDKVGLFHLDAHYDSAMSDVEMIQSIPDNFSEFSLDDFLDFKMLGGQYITYDNYLPIFLDKYIEHIDTTKIGVSTQKIRSSPTPIIKGWSETDELDFSQVPIFIDNHIIGSDIQWIFNLDLDFMTFKFKNKNFQLISDSTIELIALKIEESILSNNISCLTICLSPEFFGGNNGWIESERYCKKLFSYMTKLDLDLNLPR